MFDSELLTEREKALLSRRLTLAEQIFPPPPPTLELLATICEMRVALMKIATSCPECDVAREIARAALKGFTR